MHVAGGLVGALQDVGLQGDLGEVRVGLPQHVVHRGYDKHRAGRAVLGYQVGCRTVLLPAPLPVLLGLCPSLLHHPCPLPNTTHSVSQPSHSCTPKPQASSCTPPTTSSRHTPHSPHPSPRPKQTRPHCRNQPLSLHLCTATYTHTWNGSHTPAISLQAHAGLLLPPLHSKHCQAPVTRLHVDKFCLPRVSALQHRRQHNHERKHS